MRIIKSVLYILGGIIALGMVASGNYEFKAGGAGVLAAFAMIGLGAFNLYRAVTSRAQDNSRTDDEFAEEVSSEPPPIPESRPTTSSTFTPPSADESALGDIPAEIQAKAREIRRIYGAAAADQYLEEQRVKLAQA